MLPFERLSRRTFAIRPTRVEGATVVVVAVAELVSVLTLKDRPRDTKQKLPYLVGPRTLSDEAKHIGKVPRTGGRFPNPFKASIFFLPKLATEWFL
jgi:hypothetical protein